VWKGIGSMMLAVAGRIADSLVVVAVGIVEVGRVGTAVVVAVVELVAV